ncbi:MAG: 2-oxo acid dehydrogenase subunit E2 [Oscillospiraceae bacterium]|nr:2-oxo acid dehydrogenase subunit E2 [Oscillospiraceae bacterium]
MAKYKRKDGILVPETDPMHLITPHMVPNRCDNEAVLTELFDMTAVEAYLAKKNADGPEFKYTFFHVICAAIAKVLVLRPRMNRFYAGRRLYDRNDILFAFVVKKKFEDNGAEALAIIKVDKDGEVSPVEQIHGKVKDIVYSVRKENKTEGTTEKMGILTKLPRGLLRFVMSFLNWLDYHGRYPAALMKDDPYFASVFVSNLGSIKMHANYHHLVNWGTNSIFVVIGEKKLTPFFQPDGSVQMRDALELGLTIDERIADGVYFAKSIHLLRRLLSQPELLDEPIQTPVDYESELV